MRDTTLTYTLGQLRSQIGKQYFQNTPLPSHKFDQEQWKELEVGQTEACMAGGKSVFSSMEPQTRLGKRTMEGTAKKTERTVGADTVRPQNGC